MRKLIELQRAKLICLWFCGLLKTCVLNFIVIGKYTTDLSESNQGVHDFFTSIAIEKN